MTSRAFDLSELTPIETSLAEKRYLALDTSLRSRITPHEYAWMSDAQKATLESDECEPEF